MADAKKMDAPIVARGDAAGIRLGHRQDSPT